MNSVLRNRFLHIATAIIVVQGALFYSASHGENTPLPQPLRYFPTTLSDWHLAREFEVEPDVLEVLKADDTLSRTYVSPEGGASLFIAYFKTQRQGQSPHSPKNCLPGAGYQPSESGTINVPVGDRKININHYVISKGEEEDVVLYWYQSQGRVIADEFAAKFYLIEDSIRNHRSDTSLVRVITPVIQGNRERANNTAIDFVKSAYPVVSTYLPQ